MNKKLAYIMNATGTVLGCTMTEYPEQEPVEYGTRYDGRFEVEGAGYITYDPTLYGFDHIVPLDELDVNDVKMWDV